MCRRLIVAVSVLVLSLATAPVWGIDGTFQGRVVNPPAGQSILQGWIYVQGRNQMLRRVDISHADIVFAQGVLESQRHKCDLDCISPGEEVRVTAEQDGRGEWRAKRVEILKLTTSRA